MSIKNIFFFIFVSSLLAISFAYNKSFFIIIGFIFLIVLAFKKFGYKIPIILVGVFLFFSFYRINRIDKTLNNTSISCNATIYEVKNTYILIKDENNNNYFVYIKDDISYQKEDIISIDGQIKLIENDLELDVFDFKEYLNNKRVYYQISDYKINIIKKDNSLSAKIIDFITKRLKGNSLSMTKMLLFSDKTADVETYNNLKEINALHLFVVSGFHISFFFNLLQLIFKKNKYLKIIIPISFIFFYVFLLDFSISATRAFLTLILSLLFKKHLNKLDCISITGILFLLIEPLNIFNYSFIMSYLMTITITFTSNAIKNQNKLLQLLITSLICFLAMIPIQLLLNYKINFISLFTNIILSYIVLLIFILCLLGLPLSLISGNLFGGIYSVFNNFISKISDIKLSITFGSLNSFAIVIYYGILLLLLYYIETKKVKRIGLAISFIFLFMICLYNRHLFIYYQQVTFLNVYQGDCAIIQDSFNGKVMLIDTGGLLNYDIANKKIMPYLNYHGIRKIDIVVISHEDYDHYGALETLKSSIQIKQIIKDPTIDSVSLGKIYLENLNHYYNESSSENDKSIVLYGNICSLNFLFTGDISANIENKIIANNPNLEVDVLKVAHHGSSTSTSETFIQLIKPKYAIISVGANNYYGHPTDKVINTLINNDVIIFRTDINGSTRFKKELFNKQFIESAK